MNLDDEYNKYTKKIVNYKKNLLKLKKFNFVEIIKKKNDIYNEFGYILGFLKLENKDIINILNKELNNKEIYNIFIDYYINYYNIEKEYLDIQDKKYVELLYNIYNNNGLNLDKLSYNYLEDINNTIITLNKIIISNISKYKSNNYKKYYNILKLSDNKNTRNEHMKIHSNECIENKEFIYKLIKFKNKKAKLLGYNNFSEYIIKDNMAKNIKNVLLFLDNIKKNILIKLNIDLDLIKNEARKDNINIIEESDLFYYINKLSSNNIYLGKIEFILDKIILGIFNLYKKLYDYDFIIIKNDKYNNLYKVIHNNKIIGYLLLDLLKNNNKYTTAEIEILVNKTDKLVPFCNIKCNFEYKIYFDELIIFFHEFGHFIQIISSDAKYNFDSSYNIDFEEVSSQVLEEFCYNKEILQLMTNDIITDDYINFLKKKKKEFNSIELANQLIISYVDIYMHSDENINIDTLYNNLYKEIFGFNNIINPIYILDHLYEGYDSRYYSYLWSNIYSKDIYVSKFENNEFNKIINKDYKDNFLSKLDYEDSYILYKKYMGRDVCYENFFKDI